MIKHAVGEILSEELARAQSRVDALARELDDAEKVYRAAQTRHNEARGRMDDLLVTLSEETIETREQAIERKLREQEAPIRALPIGGRS